ncbi:MAG: hypothetical protein IPH00_16645 [Flavobacteriales bacterium]|nr:hypothetical protein [Flavobacteriales bacterium]MBK7247285.1 hypothetical protein [Flavobacteriales bacterium]HQY04138.1 TRL domain-containing protein [Flavobacteriales bacterium]
MKKSLKMFVLAMGAMAFTSCGMVLPVAATSNPVGPKTGKAKATTVLGVFHVHGDAGILKACRNGEITEISTVELSQANYFFWQRTICTVNGK